MLEQTRRIRLLRSLAVIIWRIEHQFGIAVPQPSPTATRKNQVPFSVMSIKRSSHRRKLTILECAGASFTSCLYGSAWDSSTGSNPAGSISAEFEASGTHGAWNSSG